MIVKSDNKEFGKLSKCKVKEMKITVTWHLENNQYSISSKNTSND